MTDSAVKTTAYPTKRDYVSATGLPPRPRYRQLLPGEVAFAEREIGIKPRGEKSQREPVNASETQPDVTKPATDVVSPVTKPPVTKPIAVTKPAPAVTKPVAVAKPQGGRPSKGDAPMTAAERMRLSRARKAEAKL